MNSSLEDFKKQILVEIENYTEDESKFKDYFLSMKELNVWLSEMEK
jgi:hypothetical protein